MSGPDSAQLLSERFATHALETRFEDLTDDAIAQAKIFILDTIGVGISGSSAFGADKLLQVSLNDGEGSASIWGRDDKISAKTAALVNGYQIHCQEYDCVHEAGLGIASRSGLTFFRPATAGGFGATAAVGRLMGLSHESLVQAFGLQYAQTSGTLQPHVEGSTSLPMQVGVNARAAILSCELAQAGFPGPRDVFEGPYGYLRLFEAPNQWDLQDTYQCLKGKRWLISELSHKPYPAVRATHAGVEGLQVLRKNNDGSVIAPQDIKGVIITGPPVTARLCARPDLPNPSPTYARLCMPYVGAKVLLNGIVDLAHYRGAELTDDATHDLAKRIQMLSDGGSDPNALVPITVELETTTGVHKSWRCDQMLASPSRRLSREAHLTKFRRCWEFAALPLPEEARESMIRTIDELENIEDVRVLSSLLVSSSVGSSQAKL